MSDYIWIWWLKLMVSAHAIDLQQLDNFQLKLQVFFLSGTVLTFNKIPRYHTKKNETNIHPWRLTWNIIMEVWFRSFPFLNGQICRFQSFIFQGYRTGPGNFHPTQRGRQWVTYIGPHGCIPRNIWSNSPVKREASCLEDHPRMK